MDKEEIKKRAYEIKSKVQSGLLSYEEAMASPELKEFEEFYNRVGKEIAKKHGKTFYKFNKSKFLR